MIAKHDADIKGFKQNLLDAEEALKIAQKKNDALETQAEELKKQAEQAKVCMLCSSASNCTLKSICFSESLFFAWLHHFIVGFLQCFFLNFSRVDQYCLGREAFTTNWLSSLDYTGIHEIRFFDVNVLCS